MMNGQQATGAYAANHGLAWQRLVDDNAVLVKRIAHHLLARLPANVLVEDLIQAGMLGLLEAAQKYQSDRGASFETYAGIRIRGAMLDEVRRGDWAPRSVHRNARRISTAIATLSARLARSPKETEIAEELELTLGEYHTLLQDSVTTKLFSYEQSVEDDPALERAGDGPSPFDGMSRERLLAEVATAISQLSDREQLVLALYYDEELNLKEIGAVLGVTESRVSQIHSQAALRLRARLAEWQNA